MLREVKTLRASCLALAPRSAVEAEFFVGRGIHGRDTCSVQVGHKAVVVVHLQNDCLRREWFCQCERVPEQDNGRAGGELGRIVVITISEPGRSLGELAVIEVDGGPAGGCRRLVSGFLVGRAGQVLPVGAGWNQRRLERDCRGGGLQGFRCQGDTAQAGHPDQAVTTGRNEMVRERPLVEGLEIIRQAEAAKSQWLRSSVVEFNPVTALTFVVDPVGPVRSEQFVQPQVAKWWSSRGWRSG